MAVSVVESNIGTPVALSSTATTSSTCTLATTPAAGDVVYACVAIAANVTVTSVTGLGATWTLHYAQVFSANQRVAIYKGTGATSAGTVTATFPISGLLGIYHQTGAFLVRGLPNTTATYHAQSAWNVGDSATTGTVRTAAAPAGSNALALAVFAGGNGAYTTGISADTPGWTTLASTQGGATPTGGFTFGVLPVNSTSANVQLSSTYAAAGYLSWAIDIIGGPDGARAQAAYLEAATSNPGAARLDGTYLEAAISNPGAVRADGVYLETLAITVTQLKEYGAYLEVLAPAPKPKNMQGWGLVIRGS